MPITRLTPAQLKQCTGNQWSHLIRQDEFYAQYCDWEKLEVDNWVDLLRVCPQYAYHEPWRSHKWVGWAWALLLRAQPQFAEHCNWENITAPVSWSYLLEDQPQFAEHCHIWHLFMAPEWLSLLMRQPQFVCHCPASKLRRKAWQSLHRLYPTNEDIEINALLSSLT